MTRSPLQRKPRPSRAQMEPPPAEPYRRPRHQVLLVARDGRATLGIGHAGEVLAAVKMSTAELASLGLRALELAVEAGHDLDEIEQAARAQISRRRSEIRARQRLDRRNEVRRAAREARVRAGTCQDCGTDIVKTGRGPMTKRCVACREKRHRNYYHDRKSTEGQPTRPLRATCRDCGQEVPILTKGPVPKRCVSCAKAYSREQNRERARNAWRLKHWGNTEARPDDR